MSDQRGRLLMGWDGIGGYLGLTPRQVRHLASRGLLPVFKLPKSKLPCARPDSLEAYLASQEAAALESAQD